MSLPRRRARLAALAGLYLGSLACRAHAPHPTASPPAERRALPPAWDVAPARAALARLLPRHASQITVRAAPAAARGADWVEVSGTVGHLEVAATSAGASLAGVDGYLRHVAHVDIGWPGRSDALLPALLPSAPRLRTQATFVHRFALNDTHEGYSGPYRDWSAWEAELDVLALRGLDEVLVTIGSDEVYRRTFREHGYSDAEIRAWIPAPAHQPWWLLQNMCCYGGPISARLLEQRLALAQRVVARLRELGITPVLPGYFGTVPDDFARRNPGARVIAQGEWGGFARPGWLDPRTPEFARVAATFYRHQRELLGDTTMFKMDVLHEGGQAGDVPIGDAARGVERALHVAHPAAVWSLLGWENNPRTEVLDAVDRTQLLVVDGRSDAFPDLDREATWHGTPYAFGTILDFGGKSTLGANAGVWTRLLPAWRNKPNSALRGIAFMPEATGTSPAGFELFTELGWRDDRVDPHVWFAAYATRRYGRVDPHATAAWAVLGRTAYGTPNDGGSAPHDTLFGTRPGLEVKFNEWANEVSRYDLRLFASALGELLQVDPALREVDAYRFDLVDVARQALSNTSRTMLPLVKAAFQARDRAALRRWSARWLARMALLDELLATDTRFLLGPWLADARRAAGDDEEATRLEHDARAIVTTWGDRPSSEGGLHDYANRDRSGLVSRLYAVRWQRFFTSLERALADGRPPQPIDWFALDDAWAHARDAYPTEARGDAHEVASRVWRDLQDR